MGEVQLTEIELRGSHHPVLATAPTPAYPAPSPSPCPSPIQPKGDWSLNTQPLFFHPTFPFTPVLYTFPTLFSISAASRFSPSPVPLLHLRSHASCGAPIVTDRVRHTPAPAPYGVAISGAGVGMADSPRAFALPQALRSMLHRLFPIPVKSHSHPTSYR